MGVNSQSRSCGSRIFDDLNLDKSTEVQPLEAQSYRVQTFKDQSLQLNTVDIQTFAICALEGQSVGVQSFQATFLDNSRKLYSYVKPVHEDITLGNLGSVGRGYNEHQCWMNFSDYQYQIDTSQSQTFKPTNDKPNFIMRQYLINKIPLVMILTLGYLVAFSIMVLTQPDFYRQQTSEYGASLSVQPLFLSVSKRSQATYPGFQPPLLSTTIHPCQPITLSLASLTRQKLQIFCDKKSVWSNFTTVRSNFRPYSIQSSSSCLEMYIQSNCYDGRKVPNVVHYVWFNKHSLDVYTYLSVISVYKNIRPCLILVHADILPYGPYWNHLLTLIPNIIHVQTVAPSRIFGRKFGYVQHKSDIARLKILKAHGGIYFDVDQIALKSFDEFRHHQFVMAHESNKNLGNAVIISEKNAPFLDIWYKNYNSYNPKQWGYHSTFLPLELSKKHPHLIHIENKTFFDIDLSQMSELYHGHVKWSESTAIHLYVRWMKKYFTLNELRTTNTSLGEMARFIMYDSIQLCKG